MSALDESMVLAPETCGGCPRLRGIAVGLDGLHGLGDVTADDVAELATLACGSCADRPASAKIRESPDDDGGTITRLWLKLWPRVGGRPITHGLDS